MSLNQLRSATQISGLGVWADWTPTYTGFSANPVITCRYAQIGKVVFFDAYGGTGGTSNATTFTITLPVSSSAAATYSMNFTRAVDNSALSVGMAYIGPSSNVCTLYSSVALAGWTASGTKAVSFTLTYEAA